AHVRPTGGGRQDRRHLVQVHRLRPGQLVRLLAVPGGVLQHQRRYCGHVVQGDRGDPAGTGWAGDHPVGPGEVEERLGVEVVPQEGPVHPGVGDVVLGGAVVPGEGEPGGLAGSGEREVDEVAYPGGDGRVDEGVVVVEPGGGLGRRDHEGGVDAVERSAD